MDINEQIKEKRKEKWFDVWFDIEALAVKKETVEKALSKHVENMRQVKGILIYETKYGETVRREKPMKDIAEAYSQIVKVKFFAKNFSILIGVVLTYGPSAIEIMSPDHKEIKIDEAQDIVNLLAGLVHQYAAAGIGGLVISGK